MYRNLIYPYLIFFLISCKKDTPELIDPIETIKPIEIDEKYTGVWQWRSSRNSKYNKNQCQSVFDIIPFYPLENDINLKIILNKKGFGCVTLNDSVLNSFIITKKISYEKYDYFYTNCGEYYYYFDKNKQKYNVGDTNNFFFVHYIYNHEINDYLIEFNRETSDIFIKIE